VRLCLERIPPELAADVVDTGIVLTGGGALQRGLETELRAATHLPIRIGAEPSHCAVLGAGRALEESALLTAMSVPT
jgi:rod shape-determining protein MreB